MGMKKPSRPFLKSRRWPALRLQALRRDGWRCVQCGGRGRLEVDHILATRDHPHLAFELANLQTLCSPCHTRKTHIDLGRVEKSPERRNWDSLVKSLSKSK